jgi:microcompartment protein CcmL/EutN
VSFTAAIALLEFGSIAAGIEAGDAMVKRAALDVIRTGTVQPGRYLVLIGGRVAELEEAIDAALMVGAEHVVDRMFLPDPHPQLVGALSGTRQTGQGEALGIIETTSVAPVLEAADAGLKGAAVTLREIFMADGLGGKGYLLFRGPLVEVEAAVESGIERADGSVIGSRIIPQLHEDMEENLAGHGRFAVRVRGAG